MTFGGRRIWERATGWVVASARTESQPHTVGRPLTWTEYLFMAVPLVFVFSGGVLGVIVGVAGVTSSACILRGSSGPLRRYGFSFLALLGAGVTFLALSGMSDLPVLTSISGER